MDEAQAATIRAQKRRLESELFSLEGDLSRATQKHSQLLDELKRLKTMISRFEAEKQVQEQAIIHAEREMATLKSEVDQLKKKMNSL